MSRNGSGTYSVVNTFVAGGTITAAAHNQNWSDAASEITNSVAADGQTTMTGPLKASSGSVGAPSQTFASDLDTGRYRKSSNTMADVCAGAEVVEYSATGISVTGSANATTVKQGGFALIPVGFGPSPWSGLSAPSGWVLTGQTLSRATYAALWAFAETEIAGGNTFYGVGDGSTTFTIASMGGRVPAGKESSATRLTASFFGGNSTVLGATGGLESQTLALAQLPTGITSSGTNHISVGAEGSLTWLVGQSVSIFDFSDNVGSGVRAPGDTAEMANVNSSSRLGGNNSIAVTSNNTSGSAHNNTQPTIITNYIIFAGV
jgi:microcystin-dependent protein